MCIQSATYQSCPNTAQNKKAFLIIKGLGTSITQRDRATLSESKDQRKAESLTFKNWSNVLLSELSQSEIVSSLTLQMNMEELNHHFPDILEISAPGGELKVINSQESFQI